MGRVNWKPPAALDVHETASPYAHWWLRGLPESAQTAPRATGTRPAGGVNLLRLGFDVKRDRITVAVAEVDEAELRKDPKRRLAQPDGGGGGGAGGGTPSAGARAVAERLAELYGRGGVVPTYLSDEVLNGRYDAATRWDSDLIEAPEDGSVVLAVLDDGIAFAHERFRTPGVGGGPPKTRFDYVWLQGAKSPTPKSAPAGCGDASDLPFGRELTRCKIDKLLKDHWRDGVVDEEALYCEAGLVDLGDADFESAALKASHGTAVADQAGGYDPAFDKADKITLIGICLPAQVTHDTSGTFMDLYVVLALQRIRERVDALAKRRECVRGSSAPLPVVINLSYALTAGAVLGGDGGSGLVDFYIGSVASVTDAKPVRLVVPAGNVRQAQVRARLTCNGSASDAPLRWRILPDDATPSYLEIWSEERARPDRPTIVCDVSPPDLKPETDPNPPQRFGEFVDLDHDGRPVARIYYQWLTTGPGLGRERIVVAVAPTVADFPDQEVGPSGDWLVRLRSLDGSDRAVDLFVQRDDTPYGYRQRGRQSYLVDEKYERYDPGGRPADSDDTGAVVLRDGAINRYVADERIWFVGADCRTGRWPAPGSVGGRGIQPMPYSGISRRVPRFCPDASAIADESRVHRGVAAVGTLSGASVLLSGTSVAAPRVARWLAERLVGWERGDPVPTRDEAKAATAGAPDGGYGVSRAGVPRRRETD